METSTKGIVVILFVAFFFLGSLGIPGINGINGTNGTNLTIDINTKINKTDGDNLTLPFRLYDGSGNLILEFTNVSSFIQNSGIGYKNKISASNISSELNSINTIEHHETKISTSSFDGDINNTLFVSWGGLINNSIIQYPSYTLFQKQIDVNGTNILNCGNCGSSDNTKVNDTGDTINGSLTINNGYLNVTTNKTVNLNYAGLPTFYRNYSSSLLRTAPLAVLNMMLSVNTGGMSSGAGPALIFWNKENESLGNVEYNVGRTGIVWRNKTLNTSMLSIYTKNGINDVSALTPTANFYNTGLNSSQDGTANVTNGLMELGSIKLLQSQGLNNNSYGRFDSTGTFVRDDIDNYVSGSVPVCYNVSHGLHSC